MQCFQRRWALPGTPTAPTRVLQHSYGTREAQARSKLEHRTLGGLLVGGDIGGQVHLVGPPPRQRPRPVSAIDPGGRPVPNPPSPAQKAGFLMCTNTRVRALARMGQEDRVAEARSEAST